MTRRWRCEQCKQLTKYAKPDKQPLICIVCKYENAIKKAHVNYRNSIEAAVQHYRFCLPVMEHARKLREEQYRDGRQRQAERLK